MAVPYVDAGSGDDIPIRDFDTHGMGWLPVGTRSSKEQCLFLLATSQDSPLAWLRAGEALQRLWLQATSANYAASLFTQVIEVDRTRQQLREQLSTSTFPHVLIRIGRAPATPASRRRRIDDVISEAG